MVQALTSWLRGLSLGRASARIAACVPVLGITERHMKLLNRHITCTPDSTEIWEGKRENSRVRIRCAHHTLPHPSAVSLWLHV